MPRKSRKSQSLIDGYTKPKTQSVDSRGPSIVEQKPTNPFLDLFVNTLSRNSKIIRKFQLDDGTMSENIRTLSNQPALSVDMVNDKELQKIKYRCYPISDEVIEAMACSVDSFSTLKEIKLEFCNLNENHIYLIQNILEFNKNVNYLSLQGNPIPQQNHYLVLLNSNLLHLSLQLCRIDPDGMTMIAQELSKPNQKLVSLNMAGNSLGDLGAKHAGEMLRSNRCLQILDLADNGIGEVGFLWFFEPFDNFELDHEEIVLRRFKILEHLLADTKQEKQSKRRNSSSSTLSRKSGDSGKKKRSNSAEVHTKRSNFSVASVSLKSVATRKSRSNQPFVDDVERDGAQLVCKGNNSLTWLNLSYNIMTVAVLKRLIDIINYQKATWTSGLKYVITEQKSDEGLSTLLEQVARMLHMTSSVSELRKGSNLSKEKSRSNKSLRKSDASRKSAKS